MPIITAVLTWLGNTRLGQLILTYVFGKLVEVIKDAYTNIALKKKIEKEAIESAKPLKEATTKKEIDDATDSILDNF